MEDVCWMHPLQTAFVPVFFLVLKIQCVESFSVLSLLQGTQLYLM